MWFYLDFAEPGKHLGCCIVNAMDSINAVEVAHLYGLNPGGEVMIIELGEKFSPEMEPYRLYSEEEITELDGGRKPFKGTVDELVKQINETL